MTTSTDKDLLDIEKIRSEITRNIEEGIHLRKKNRWFEVSLALAVFALGIAFAKLFL